MVIPEVVLPLTRSQVCNFLNHMAFEMDLEDLQPLEDEGSEAWPLKGANFNPTRRKMLVVQNPRISQRMSDLNILIKAQEEGWLDKIPTD